VTAMCSPDLGQTVAPSPRARPVVVEVTLVALHTAIRFSGLLARYTAKRWKLHHLANTAERVTAELITRAVETTGNPDPHPRYNDLEQLRLIGIRISHTGQDLLIEVWDSNPTPPKDTHLDNHLSTVEHISRQWGCYLPNDHGKVIWAALSADGGDPSRTTGPRSTLHANVPTQRNSAAPETGNGAAERTSVPPALALLARGSSKTHMVGAAGFEPATPSL
jgi:hypothetical protein